MNGLFESHTFFIHVILPLHVGKAYTYAVPEHLIPHIQVGMRVVVNFNRSRLYTAIVSALDVAEPDGYRAKAIEEILDEAPIVTQTQLNFWQWIADYYMSPIGMVMQAALPSALKLASKTFLTIHPDWDTSLEDLLDNKEFMIYDALLANGRLDMDEAAKVLNRKSAFSVVKSLIIKGVVQASEELVEKYKARKEDFISLADDYKTDDALRETMNTLERSPKQLEALLIYLQFAHDRSWVKKSDLKKRDEKIDSFLKALVDKGILLQQKFNVSRFEEEVVDIHLTDLSAAQKVAVNQINQIWTEKSVALLFGVTGSGKTRVYIELIAQALEEGKQVLYLVPEIALSTQLIARLRRAFGNLIGVYHSKMSDSERAEMYTDVARGKFPVLLGIRSALFLPFEELGLVVVDEEHETGYKQHDTAPRFHARDAALFLAHQTGAKVILGSATPAIETFQHAKTGKYGLVELTERYGGAQLPDIHVVDMLREGKVGRVKGAFSQTLLDEMAQTTFRKEQVILLRNRRGYIPLHQCTTCGVPVQCPNCDVNLNYHKFSNRLQCHYCGHKQAPISTCEHCGSTKMGMFSYGTEKVEEDLEALFPDLRIGRLDQDTVKKKSAYKDIIKAVETGKIHILVGTQMVSKGLDFESVTLVGVLTADQTLSIPDVRSSERCFQQLTQVAGRAGRHLKKGKVIVQTRQPLHHVFDFLVKGDYKAFFAKEILERKQFGYPPFSRLITLHLSHPKENILDEAANILARKLIVHFGRRILGPAAPVIAKLNNKFYREIQIACPLDSASLKKIKTTVQAEIDSVLAVPAFRQVFISPDVDPY